MTARPESGQAPSAEQPEQTPPEVSGAWRTDPRISGVLGLLRGEPLNDLAEELDVGPELLLAWRDAFLAGGRERLERFDGSAAIAARTARPRTPFPRSWWVWATVLGAVVLVGVAVVAVIARSAVDDGWRVVHDGYGRAGVEATEEGQTVHYLAPTVSNLEGETHAALKATNETYEDFDLRVRVRTIEQLRQGTAPNPWEVGWVLWHYTDDRHFYYLALKPNGWELGKRDPEYPGGQRFLASDTTPTFYFNTWYEVRIVQIGDQVSVWVDDLHLATFEDEERPYGRGEIGLYSEDAYAQFADVRIGNAPEEMPTATAPSPGS